MKAAHRFEHAARRVIPRSLEGRLLGGSALATAVALAFVLLLTYQVLARFVTGQIDQRLDNEIVVLAGNVRVAPDGIVSLTGLDAPVPPFDGRDHHSFWIVQGPRNAIRPFWLAPGDGEMPSQQVLAAAFARPVRPPPPPDGVADRARTVRGQGLDGTMLHERVARRSIAGVSVTILAAAPTAMIEGPIREAMTRVALDVLALGLVLGALALAQVRLGLRPLKALRVQVAQVADGRRDVLPTRQPREIAPLVAEMNRLLEGNAANLEKARRHVANLAHGLKTPLATLSLLSSRLEGPGKEDLGPLLAQIDLRIRHHLARARAGALAGPERARSILAPRLADVGDALRLIHAARAITFVLDAPADLAVACEAQDLDEIFGNLLDNAFKFARSRVTCEARLDGRHVDVRVSDDGDGLTSDEAAIVMRPGQRLDERKPGFGFGLTIARELVELYGGELTLEPGRAGLTVVVTLPTGADMA